MNKVTIIGTGPAGLTAAIYAARAQLEPVIYSGIQHGGQLTTTTEVENYPGFAKGIDGPRLMEDMTAQAERFGTRIVYDAITAADFSGHPLKLHTTGGVIETLTVIIATGATARTLGLPEEKRLMGRGLSTCATCDGFFFRGKRVAVVGGGDSAMEEATYLANLASEVVLIHRRDEFRAAPIMVERAKKNPKITFLIPFAVTGTMERDGELVGIKLRNLETNETVERETDGLFMAIGHTPNSEIFREFVDVDDKGYIKTRNFTQTRTPGVFAAGDIADPVFRQAVTAAGYGCQAAMQAQRYIEDLEHGAHHG
ncbi:thioredoxin-disulfide reductase [bacterium]|nr:thioredoxin-disulfide reductase [bacterium]